MSPENEKKVIELLAIIYNTIDWAKMRTRHGSTTFNHRVGSSRGPLFLEAACHYLVFFRPKKHQIRRVAAFFEREVSPLVLISLCPCWPCGPRDSRFAGKCQTKRVGFPRS